ncbi:hypothetical protein [Vibrio owensii]|uniref:hypothetical protein n=1 Tax=Vibrio harveyi group TaxID=717610 RepID=UPI003CC5BBD5
MRVFVNSKTKLVFSSSPEPDEDWGAWKKQNEFEIESATSFDYSKVDPTIESNDFEVAETESGVIYVLLVRYSDGDSFGTEEGKGEVIWAYSDEAMAEKALQIYEKAIKDQEYTVNLPVLDANGEAREVPIGNVVSGHFCQLESIEIEGISLSEMTAH